MRLAPGAAIAGPLGPATGLPRVTSVSSA